MTALVPTGVAGFLARFESLRDRLPGDPRQRLAAAEAFRRSGLPGATAGRREEAWKYTSLRPLAETAFEAPLSLAGDSAFLERLPHIDVPRIVLIDGRFRPEYELTLADEVGTFDWVPVNDTLVGFINSYDAFVERILERKRLLQA